MTSPLKNLLLSMEKKEILLPVLRKHLAEQERKLAAGEIKYSDIEKANLRRTIKCAQVKIEEYNHGDASDEEFFHPSQIGACIRQLWFQRKKAPKDGTKLGNELLTSHMVFETGSASHVIFQNLCAAAGVLVKREIAIIDEKRKIMGHADGIVRLNGAKHILEIKTINTRGFTTLMAPKPEHIKQATLYMRSLGLRSTVFVYLEKDRHSMKEFFVEYEHDTYLAARKRMQSYFKHVKDNTVPEKEGTHPQQFPCAYCAFRKVCFDSQHLTTFVKSLPKK